MAADPKRILLLMPVTTYRADPFLEAAERLGVSVLIGSDRCDRLAALRPIDSLPLHLREPAEAAERIAEAAAQRPFDAIVAVDDGATLAAAAAAKRLGLPHNRLESVEASRNKYRMRQRLREAGVPSPAFELHDLAEDPEALASRVRYPCVLKPLLLSGSRGVIRADDPASFVRAFRRIAALLRQPHVAIDQGEWAGKLLVEDYLPGREFALEGLLGNGRLHVLALFDKPDPLEGPFFEETVYVTPSSLSDADQRAVAACAEAAARALGLEQGPVHAELRLNERGPWIVEVAARSIGGRCSRILRFGAGASLEELLLRQALGLPIASLQREQPAAGVLMIPIPGAGALLSVDGLEAARAVPHIEDVEITVKPGEHVVPLPEGAAYLGFVYARASTPAEVVRALHEAHAHLKFLLDPELPMARG